MIEYTYAIYNSDTLFSANSNPMTQVYFVRMCVI